MQLNQLTAATTLCFTFKASTRAHVDIQRVTLSETRTVSDSTCDVYTVHATELPDGLLEIWAVVVRDTGHVFSLTGLLQSAGCTQPIALKRPALA